MGYFQDTGVLLLYGMTALLWISGQEFYLCTACTVVLSCGNIF